MSRDLRSPYLSTPLSRQGLTSNQTPVTPQKTGEAGCRFRFPRLFFSFSADCRAALGSTGMPSELTVQIVWRDVFGFWPKEVCAALIELY